MPEPLCQRRHSKTGNKNPFTKKVKESQFHSWKCPLGRFLGTWRTDSKV
jgi:hypothetical protein